MPERVFVREALTLEGIVYGPTMGIPLVVWLRLPVKQRNRLENTGKVEVTRE